MRSSKRSQFRKFTGDDKTPFSLQRCHPIAVRRGLCTLHAKASLDLPQRDAFFLRPPYFGVSVFGCRAWGVCSCWRNDYPPVYNESSACLASPCHATVSTAMLMFRPWRDAQTLQSFMVCLITERLNVRKKAKIKKYEPGMEEKHWSCRELAEMRTVGV